MRCQRGGCWATKFSCFRCGGVFQESQFLGVLVMVRHETFLLQLGACWIKGARRRDWPFRMISLLGCSAAVLGEVQEAVKAKTKPRVVPAAEHTVFVLKDKWDRAEAHRKGLQETAERRQREYEAAAQRATDQAVGADDLKKAYWEARKELDKTAASCASASFGECESVSSGDGLANAGLDGEEIEQVFPECVLDPSEAPPAKRVKATCSSSKSIKDQNVPAEAPPPPLISQVQYLPVCQDEEQIMRAVQTWSSDAIDMAVRLCAEHRNQEEALRGLLGNTSAGDK